jgi:hypothetical protein
MWKPLQNHQVLQVFEGLSKGGTGVPFESSHVMIPFNFG